MSSSRVISGLLGCLALASPLSADAQGGLDQAEPIGPFLDNALPPEAPRPATGNWTLINAFPSLTFIDPVQMIPVPGTNQLIVVEKNGRLAVFENEPDAASKTILFDVSSQVQSTTDSGMLGLAFHPEFGRNGSPNRDFLYVFYRYTPDKSQKNQAYCRLSRFTWPAGSDSINPNSEFVLINQYDRHNWHNGGGMFFGPDGFLYLSIGDEGGANDVYGSGQKIHVGLLAGVLRIDVDQDLSRSHPIRRQPRNPASPPGGWPDSYSQGYTIPDDNPWLSPSGDHLEEFYAIGLRSPHRMTRDPVTNRIWVGDVGQSLREEVSLVEKGANLQWPYRQGDIAGPKSKPNPLIGFDQPPVWAYPRSQGGCVIGGYVYRGSLHPDLAGKYLVGDYNNGKIRALTHIPGQAPVIEDLLTLSRHGPGPKNGLGAFGIDASGEIYILSLAGTDQDGGIIYRLDRTGPGVPEPPSLLSRTGAFADLATLTPNPGIIPYDLIQPLWSDGAGKQRWIAIPNDGDPNSPAERIGFSENGEWSFPIGTVLIKHFEYGGRRLETRFLVHGADGQYYGVTYRWRADGSDADLLPGPPVDETIDLGGGQSVDWHFPGRTECFTCHTEAAGIVLGPKTRHLNRDLLYPVTGRTANQITTLNQLGFLSPAPNENDIPGFLTAANVTDASETLDRRARSYLDINCSQCHRPNGPTQAVFDTLLTTPSYFQNTINVVPADDLGVSGARIVKPQSPAESVLHLRLDSLAGCCAMPPLAKNAVDADAVRALADWINSLDPTTAPSSTVSGPAPADYSLPTAALSIPGGDSNVGGAFQVDVDFSESVIGLALSDLIIANGTASALTGAGTGYSITITPTAEGAGSVSLPADAVTDANGNANPASDTIAFTYTEPSSGPGLQYEYFEGDFSQVPDFSSLTPDKSGVVANLDLSPRLSEDTYAFRFFGGLNIATAGDYTFHLSSDDGSVLSIGGAVVVDHDGFHPAYPKSGTVTLGAGVHAFEVGFFESYGDAALTLEIEGPGLPRQPIPDALLSQAGGGGGSGPVNLPPVLAPILNRNTDLGDSASLQLSATDPENETLTFSAAGLPTGLVLNPATGAITGTPTAAGVFVVDVTVSDPGGATDSEAFTWIVIDPSGSGQPGLVYHYFEGDFSQVPDFSTLTPDKSGVVPDIDLSPRLSEDTYAFRFLGNITIPAQGAYTFHLRSDDGSRLWINGVLVVDNDGFHGALTESGTVNLAAGLQGIEIGFFESYGQAVLALEIEGPGLPRQPVPASFFSHGGSGGGNLPPDLAPIANQSHEIGDPVNLSLAASDANGDALSYSAIGLPDGLSVDTETGDITGSPTTSGVFNVTVTVDDGTGGTDDESFTWLVSDPGSSGGFPGLQYEYFEQAFTQLPDFSSLVPVDTGTVANFDLSPRQRDDSFAFRFFGKITIPVTGDYTFHLTSDDGSRLWIDGLEVVNNDGLHGAFTRSGSVNLDAGTHTIEVGFFEWYGGQVLAVEIAGPGLPRQPVPDSFLTYLPGGSEAGNSGSGGGGSGSGGQNASGDPDGGGSASLARIRRRFQPDNWIGTAPLSQRGNDIYDTTGRLQTVPLRMKQPRTRKFFFTVQNDRRVPDTLFVRATRGDRNFGLIYFLRDGWPKNVTGAITRAGHRVDDLAPDARLAFVARVKPKRRNPGRRIHRRVSIDSISTFPGLGQDRVRAILKQK